MSTLANPYLDTELQVGPVKKLPKLRDINKKTLLDILKPTDFRLVKNEPGLIVIKKGYGVGITLTFDGIERSTTVYPWNQRKKIYKEDLAMINEITRLLAR